MRGLRIVLKGLSDTFEHMLPFAAASLGWWLAVGTVMFGPPATVVLFNLADPRNGTELDRPNFRETLALVKRRFVVGWKLAVVAGPLLLLLTYNLWYYGSRESALVLLWPLWLVLAVLLAMIATAAFALAALLDRPAGAALRGAALVTVGQLPRAALVGFVLAPIVLLFAMLVVPLVMFGPALVAAVVNRFVIDALRIPVVDPLAPTAERLVEETRKREAKRFGP